MSFCVTSSARKARRKQEREQKKQNKRGNNKKSSTEISKNGNANEDPSNDESSKRKAVSSNPERALGKKARRSPSFHSSNDPYAKLPPEVAEAMRRDDDEIADLEAKLGLSGGGGGSGRDGKSRLNQEYAKKECFGADFGRFLDDLDGIVERVITQPATPSNENGSGSKSDDSDEDISGSDTENTSDGENVEKDTAE
jgi:hypothetical protein